MSLRLLKHSASTLSHGCSGYTRLPAVRQIPKYQQCELAELGMALKAPNDKFRQKYGFDKPQPADPVVFFCATGVRSARALKAVQHMGYKNLCTSRSYSQDSKMSITVTPDKHLLYDDLSNLMARKEIYLIDVREPHELKETGELPGSVNIPMTELQSALKDLNYHDFQKKYKAKKPSLDAPLVFSCRSGLRSLKALQMALDLGYTKSKHYKGGYTDWEEHQKKDTN